MHPSRTTSRLVFLHQERKWNHDGTSDSKDKDHIVVGQGCCLLLHPVIEHVVGALGGVSSAVSGCHHPLCQPAELALEGSAPIIEMRRKIVLVLLRALREQGFYDGDADAP